MTEWSFLFKRSSWDCPPAQRTGCKEFCYSLGAGRVFFVFREFVIKLLWEFLESETDCIKKVYFVLVVVVGVIELFGKLVDISIKSAP